MQIMKTLTITTCLFLGSVSVCLSQATTLETKEAIRVCNLPQEHWINFCNGLMQGFADYAVLSGNACIPVGTTRTTMVTLLAGLKTDGVNFKDSDPALITANKLLKKYYGCS